MTLFGRLAEVFRRRHTPLPIDRERYPAEYRPHVAFDTDIPTDALEDEEGMDFIVWGGENLARVISEYLAAAGYEMSEPISAQHAGWEFEARKPHERFWLRICEFGDSRRYLVTEDWFAGWPREAHVRLLTAIDKGLRADGRFHNIKWFDRNGSPDGDEPGWAHPTQAEPAEPCP